MSPVEFGGEMIDFVYERATWKELPWWKFELERQEIWQEQSVLRQPLNIWKTWVWMLLLSIDGSVAYVFLSYRQWKLDHLWLSGFGPALRA